jgi:GTPase
MSKSYNTFNSQETAILIGVIKESQNEKQVREFIDELSFLATTAGALPVKTFLQRLEFPNPRTYVGEGKLAEIAEFIEANSIDLVICYDELSPSQIRNIEKILNKKILDRTNLILDIFAKRAKTSSAKVQVELAQYQYLLPRLTGMWTHLEKQRGGIGLRGPGETEIETDRRIIRNKISKLKAQLMKIDSQMATQRKNREKMIRVALVGYTNVGKSTIMNLLSKSDVFAEDKLFATLDTTVRKVVINDLPFLLSDTVGFIRKLPVNLVESFKSTLDEVREADILLHIADISQSNFEEQIDVVNQTLADLKAIDKKIIIVFNKIDKFVFHEKNPFIDLGNNDTSNLDELKNSWMAKGNSPCIFISAKKKENIEELKNLIYTNVKEIYFDRYPNNLKL